MVLDAADNGIDCACRSSGVSVFLVNFRVMKDLAAEETDEMET